MFKKILVDITINCIYITIPSLVATGLVKKDIYWVMIPTIVLSRMIMDDKTNKLLKTFWNKVKDDNLIKIDFNDDLLNRLYN